MNDSVRRGVVAFGLAAFLFGACVEGGAPARKATAPGVPVVPVGADSALDPVRPPQVDGPVVVLPTAGLQADGSIVIVRRAP